MIPPSGDLERKTAKPNPYRVVPQLSNILAELDTHHINGEQQARLLRPVLDNVRREIEAGARPTAAQVLARCKDALAEVISTRLDEAINGTGVILHTNLGRSPVSDATASAMAAASANYLSLEVDPETNRRGGRMDEIHRLLNLLTGAEATLVVNNNAAAVLLTLAALCAGRDVIVSRGEAVEIGGGFRIPDVVAQGGCRLIEVGTTNRTHLSDYLAALSDSSGAILRVHPSNFRISGFTSKPTAAELATLACENETILIEDLGSGAFIDTAQFGLASEPTVSDAIASGVAIVTFSGDKLLGGPQAGIICGRADLIRTIERHPLARAVRVDKVTLAGVAATLRHYVAGEAETAIPIWRMIGTEQSKLRGRAARIAAASSGKVIESVASIGGGSMPGETLPSAAISLATNDADALARRLRTGTPRVFPVIRDGAVMIDVRTVLPSQDETLTTAILGATK